MLRRGKKYVPTWLVLGFLVVGLLGFSDAGYLTVSHFKHQAPTCSILQGCDIVTTSSYATVGSIPVAVLGVLYYLVIVILSVVYFDTKAQWVKRVLPHITVFGFIASVYFVLVQVFMLQAICLYCMGSAVTSTILFILGLLTLRYNK